MKAEETRECLVNGEQVKPGTRNEEMRNGKRWKWKTTEIGNQMGDENFSFISACPFCIQQHLLERTSATRDSGEEVEHMQQLNAQKSIDHTECCGCVTSHRTGRAELVYGLDKLVEQLF